MSRAVEEQALLKKIRTLPLEKVAEVENFVDFLRGRLDGRRLVRTAAKRSEDAFRKVWDNQDDAAYDKL